MKDFFPTSHDFQCWNDKAACAKEKEENCVSESHTPPLNVSLPRAINVQSETIIIWQWQWLVGRTYNVLAIASIRLLANMLESGSGALLYLLWFILCAAYWRFSTSKNAAVEEEEVKGKLFSPLNAWCDNTIRAPISARHSKRVVGNVHQVRNHTILLLHWTASVCQCSFSISSNVYFSLGHSDKKKKTLVFFLFFLDSLFSSSVVDRSGRLHHRLSLSHKSGRSLLPLVAVAGCP